MESVQDQLKRVSALEAKRKIYDMIELARSDPKVIVIPEELDADTMVLNVKNGILDLRTGTLTPHHREALCTKLGGRRILVLVDPCLLGGLRGTVWEPICCPGVLATIRLVRNPLVTRALAADLPFTFSPQLSIRAA